MRSHQKVQTSRRARGWLGVAAAAALLATSMGGTVLAFAADGQQSGSQLDPAVTSIETSETETVQEAGTEDPESDAPDTDEQLPESSENTGGDDQQTATTEEDGSDDEGDADQGAMLLDDDDDIEAQVGECVAGNGSACLAVNKVVVNLSEVTAEASAWTFTVQRQSRTCTRNQGCTTNNHWGNWGSATNVTQSAKSGDVINVPATTTGNTGSRNAVQYRYRVTENSGGPANYTATYTNTCGQGDNWSTLTNGAESTCTVTNTYAAGTGVVINKGGIRTGASTVSGLEGAEFELRNGTTSPGDDVIGTCTTNASGHCFIEADAGTQYWIVEKSAPTDWSSIDELYVGGSANSQTNQKYRFRTDSLSSGINHYPKASTGNSASDSGGIWANVLQNPPTAQKCGIRAGLLMDLSNSISTSQLTTYKNSTKAFVDALEGTPSSVALWTFASQSPASGSANINRPLTSVADAIGADQVKGWIDGLALPGGQAGGTNWDAGLWNVAQGADVDVLLVLTDGSPTQSGIISTSGPGNWSNFRVVEEGVFSANAVKDKGTAVIAVGVGNVEANNLQAISGPDDYYLIADWGGLQETLVKLAQGNCKGAISLHKVSTDPKGEPLVPNPETSNGLTFSLEISESVGAKFDDPMNPADPTKTEITTAADGVNGNGWAGAKYTVLNPTDTVTIEINEPSSGRFEFKDATCKIKDATGDRDVSGADGKLVLPGLHGDSIVTCSFQNAFFPALKVDKSWEVTTGIGGQEASATYEGGSLTLDKLGVTGSTDEISASLTLNPVPDSNPSGPWDVGVEHVYGLSQVGIPVTVTETVDDTNLPSNCEITSPEFSQVNSNGAAI